MVGDECNRFVLLFTFFSFFLIKFCLYLFLVSSEQFKLFCKEIPHFASDVTTGGDEELGSQVPVKYVVLFFQQNLFNSYKIFF